VIQTTDPPLILASNSETRLRILRSAGVSVTAQAARVDEDAIKRSARETGAPADDTALTLARLKASRIAGRHPEAVVIGADQMLVCEGVWFDKPADFAAVRDQLLALRGRAHHLLTAVVAMRGSAELWHYIARPRLVMRSFSDAFLDLYLDAERDAVCASVGGYRYEGAGAQLFDDVQGDFFAILGLPLLPLLAYLRQYGILSN